MKQYGEDPANIVEGYPSYLDVQQGFWSSYGKHPVVTDWVFFVEQPIEDFAQWGDHFGGVFMCFQTKKDMMGLLKTYPLLHASVVTNEQERMHFQNVAPSIREILANAEIDALPMQDALDEINRLLAPDGQHIRWWGTLGEFIESQDWFPVQVRREYVERSHIEGAGQNIPAEELEEFLDYIFNADAL